jgi:predicted nucleotidyltransferase
MNADLTPPLPPEELRQVLEVFRRYPAVSAVKLFGSRAKGTHRPYSDVDLAVFGPLGPLEGEAIALDLEDLLLPYKFDVVPMAHLEHAALREHIERVGITIFERL